MKLFIASAIVTCALAACDTTKISDASTKQASCLASASTNKKEICKCLDTWNTNLADSGCADDANYKTIIDTSQKMYDDNCGGCFPATSTVELESGKSINLDQLQLGDKVRVGPSEFSEVYFFSTEMAETTSKFVKLVTDSGAVTMTQGHYLYVNGALKVASDVQVGDNIVLGNGTHVAVNEVTSVWAPGLYNPHTLHGDIVVDGIHTSTYTNAVHPTLAHALMSPLRTMYSAGISFGKEFRETTKSMPSWLREAIQA
jgi:hypothetical protein